MYNHALNECNIIKKVYTSPVTRFSSRASPPKICVSSEISVLYCLSNKYFKVIFNALNSELPLIAANKFLKRSSVLEVTDLDSLVNSLRVDGRLYFSVSTSYSLALSNTNLATAGEIVIRY